MRRRQRARLIRVILGLIFMGAAYLPAPYAWYAPCAFALALLAAGGDILMGAIRKLLAGRVFDEDLLMSLAALGAYAIGEYPESVLVIVMAQLGEYFESYAVGRSRDAIKAMLSLRPDTATVMRAGEAIDVNSDDVDVGETIIVSPGQRVPLDGVVTAGESALDTSMLTGESLPRELFAGDKAQSGCVNLTGRIEIKVTRRAGESTAARVMALVEDAAAQKAPQERFITRFARVYTPLVVCAAALLALVPPLLAGGEMRTWLYRALTFLVVSCPCALVISVPLSFFGGIGGASRRGILIKGGACVSSLARTCCAVFDKTGTLTQGAFDVVRLMPVNMTERGLLELAALAESASTHPIARSILEAYGGKPGAERIMSVTEHAGHGVTARTDQGRVICGSARFLQREGVDCPEANDDMTGVHIALDDMYAGFIELADKPKPGAREAIEQLDKLGVKRRVMLTGDRAGAAKRTSDALNITEVRAECMPGDKVTATREIMELTSARGTLMYVGDGINDAPVLAMADTGVAMGALGADAAIEAADVVIMDDNPLKIPLALRVSRKTMRIVRQNIVFALGVKALVLLLGALGITGMWEAVFADVGVSVLAILNASRALRVK